MKEGPMTRNMLRKAAKKLREKSKEKRVKNH